MKMTLVLYKGTKSLCTKLMKESLENSQGILSFLYCPKNRAQFIFESFFLGSVTSVVDFLDDLN